MERILQYVAESRGYAIGEVMNSGFASIQISNYHTMLTGMLGRIRKKRSFESYKNYILFDEKKLRNSISGKKFVWIYGTGYYADIITKHMLKEKLYFDGYIVSDGQEKKKEFYGKKIYWLSEIQTKSNETLIILALDKKHQKEVMMNLKERFESVFEMKEGTM